MHKRFTDELPKYDRGIESSQIYKFVKFIENAKRMIIRREKELSDEEATLLRSLHDRRQMDGRNVNLINESLAGE